MKHAPLGLGWWIAYENAITPHPLHQDAEEAVRIIEATGAAWVAPRAGFNGWNDPGLTLDVLQVFAAHRIPCFPWIYPTASAAAIASTVAGFLRLVDTGLVAGIIIDAEVEYLGQAKAAEDLVGKLRSHFPELWIANAPFDYIGFHPTYPWLAFSKLDATLPQLYAYEHDDRGYGVHLPRVTNQWVLWEAANRITTPRHFIGCSYRPRFRGFRTDPSTGKQVRIPTGPFDVSKVADDLVHFLDQFEPTEPVSLYSIEATPPEIMVRLIERARPPRDEVADDQAIDQDGVATDPQTPHARSSRCPPFRLDLDPDDDSSDPKGT